MGGSLLKGRRIPTSEYHILKKEVIELLRKEVNTNDVLELYQIASKADHGDIDLIIPNDIRQLVENVLERLKYGLHKNGDTTSFLYKEVQIDLIFVPRELLFYSQEYFSYGDRSSLLGKMIWNKYKLKFSSKGLYKRYNFNNGEWTKDYVISTNYKAIVRNLLYLELYTSYNTEEELFNWVMRSPCYHKEIFQLDNLTADQRTRDSKRPFYLRWLEHINNNKPDYELRAQSVYPTLFVKDMMMKNEYIGYKQDKEELKPYVNIDLIKSITDYEGKELGKFIAYIKKNVNKSNTYIKEEVIRLYKEYVNDVSKNKEED